MEINDERKEVLLAGVVVSRMLAYSRKIGLSEPIASVAMLRSRLSTIHLTTLEASLNCEGPQWAKTRIDCKDVPARVECNTCGTRFNAHADWSPCPDCGNPGAFTVFTPYHLKLKEIQTQSGVIIKAKKGTILL